MGPKKQKGDKKKKKSEKPLTEEEQAQLMISEAKKQKAIMEQMNYLGKLRMAMEEADNENKSLRNEIRQVTRDRTDIIMFLRRRLGEKCEEALELEETNKSLGDERAKEESEFSEKMKAKQVKYNEMVENLTTEVKELTNRLTNLEEYRAQRDLLLDKNNKLESYLQTMEVRAHSIEKEYEKSNLIDKERMRREMEDKLLKFSVDFQKATKARIASATQNVIRENIAINNELALLIQSWQKLHDQNESLMTKNRYLSNEIATEKAMREKLMRKNLAQAELIDRMTYEYMKIDEFHKEADQLRRIIKNLKSHLKEKESVIMRSKEETRKIQLEKNALNARIGELQRSLGGLTRKRERNASLLRAVSEELNVPDDAWHSAGRKAGSVSMTDELLKKYDQVFGRLATLFDKDWLLEVTPGNLGENQSIATVIGPFLINYEAADRGALDAMIDAAESSKTMSAWSVMTQKTERRETPE